MNIGELFLKLGFDVDDEKLKGFNNQVINVKNELFGVQEYALAATYGIAKFVESSVQGVADLKSFTDQTGLSADALQDWQNVAVQINRNLSPESVAAGFKTLAQNLNNIKNFGVGYNKAYQILGIDPNVDDAIGAIKKARSKILAGMEPATATNLLGQIGLGPEWTSLLKVAPDRFEALAKGLRLTTEQKDNLDLLGQTIGRTTQEIINFKDQIAAKFSPQIIIGIEELNHEFHDLMRTMNDLNKLMDYIGKWTYLLEGLAVTFTAVAYPITLATAAIALLVKSMIELDKFFHGEHSSIDDINNFFDKIGLGKAVAGATKLFMPNSPDNFVRKMNDLNNKYGQGSGGQTAAPAGSSLNVHNVFNIHSTADAKDLGNSVANQVKMTIPQQNTGPVN